MRTVIAGTINVHQVESELRADLSSVKSAIRELVNNKPFGQHSEQDINDYLDLKNQEELLTLQLQ